MLESHLDYTDEIQSDEPPIDADILAKDRRDELRLLRHGAWAGELAVSVTTNKNQKIIYEANTGK